MAPESPRAGTDHAGTTPPGATAPESGIRCMLMRGGTSKGLYVLAEDLPADPRERDALLLRLMGSPDPRQVDGLGGAHPLTSKVAVVSARPDGGVDYLFLQVAVDEALVTDRQNCGNILAGVGPFAIERGLVPAAEGTTTVRIHMVNTGSEAIATVSTPGGRVTYAGEAEIAGVPGTAAPVVLDHRDTAGSSCGALFPTGHRVDTLAGVEVTCVDNGMPVVVVEAAALGVDGTEDPAALEADAQLCAAVEAVRLEAGRAMGLGDVADATVPKVCLVSPARHGGTFGTRCFIPRRVHEAIGVFAAASAAVAWAVPGTVVAGMPGDHGTEQLRVEHPTGHTDLVVSVDPAGAPDGGPQVLVTGTVRTARKLMDGVAFA
ncbi:4-oxalomesaconate tautomerase [Citricoccus sp. SGAir0253]|uniref:4-oxalomesaconate tautomerase n=1 Tax=Citricoccus sp. SGAir0253 TaxID=2567881 RepID=UPI0010CCFEA1|nr:4-oxalomesaconate tautomerase [Citricoccus sp. SGAir0253]QCU78916.1 4-oxalomesaconate tautomerase [Citricoccus sp. SGAir0253]